MFNTKNPQSFHTFLVDGTVAGTWKHTGNGIELTPFRPLAKKTLRDLETESEGLAALHT